MSNNSFSSRTGYVFVDNNLKENGTVDMQFKWKSLQDKDGNKMSVKVHLQHDFRSLKTSVYSFQFVHSKYRISVVRMHYFQDRPNTTSVLAETVLLHKTQEQYTNKFIENFMFDLTLERELDNHCSPYKLVLEFRQVPECLQVSDTTISKRCRVAVVDVLNVDVIKFVFKTCVLDYYDIQLPDDIICLLFDEYIPEALSGEQKSILAEQQQWGRLTLAQVNERHPKSSYKEKYLNDEEFARVVGMNRSAFYKLTAWKRKAMISENGLNEVSVS